MPTLLTVSHAVARVALGSYRQVPGDLLTVFFSTKLRKDKENARSKAPDFSSLEVEARWTSIVEDRCWRVAVVPRIYTGVLRDLVAELCAEDHGRSAKRSSCKADSAYQRLWRAVRIA